MLKYFFGGRTETPPKVKDDEFHPVDVSNVNAPKFRITVLPSSPLRMDARSKGLFSALKRHGLLMWEPQPNVFIVQVIGGCTDDYRIVTLQPIFNFRHSKFEYHGDAFRFHDHKNQPVKSNEFLAWVRNKSTMRISAHRGTLVLYTTTKEWVMCIDHTTHTIQFR